MYNSIISTHRNRLGSLRAFLQSILISSKYHNEEFEVIISDLHPNEESEDIIDEYRDKFSIKHIHNIGYRGSFWKTKCINQAVLNSSGYYITHLDIDAVVPPHFIESIESFYEGTHSRVKLAHRVRFLNKETSDYVKGGEFDEEYMYYIISNAFKISSIATERYTLKNLVSTREFIPEEWRDGNALGCSHFTMRREDFIAIGGMDENMIGWGLEDTDFNWRAFRYLGGGYIRTEPSFSVYNVIHDRDKEDPDWYAEHYKENARIYDIRRMKKTVIILRGKDWGVI